jgi:hypothetical protein
VLCSAYFAGWMSKALFVAQPFRPLHLQQLLSGVGVQGTSAVAASAATTGGSALLQRTSVFAASGYSFALCKAFSAAAHTFGCRSERDCRFWFGLDYVGLVCCAATLAPASLYLARVSGTCRAVTASVCVAR